MFEKSLSLKPGVVDVLCALGLVLQAQNQHSKAVDVYYQVRRKRGKNDEMGDGWKTHE